MDTHIEEKGRAGAVTAAGTRLAPSGGPARRVRRAAAALAWGPAGVRSPAGRRAVNVLALAGAALMVVSAVIHLDLWAGGYRGIASIGPLFLAQGVAGILVAVTVAVFRRIGLLAAGAGLMAATAFGLLLSAWTGLFGFQESLAVPYAGASLAVEFGSAALLLACAGLILAAGSSFTGRGIPWKDRQGKRSA